jgi:hypothetical protein
MIRQLIAAVPPEVARWCAYALVLLAPGSFIVLPLLWLARQMHRRGGPVPDGRLPARREVRAIPRRA